MALADFYPEGTTALASDSEQRSLVKIVALLGGGIAPPPGTYVTLHGNGSPQGTVTGLKGQLYVDDLTQQVWANTSGGNTWGP